MKTETPEQYGIRTYKELNPNTIVWFICPAIPHWDYMEYSKVKDIDGVIMIIADTNGKPDKDYDSREVLLGN